MLMSAWLVAGFTLLLALALLGWGLRMRAARARWEARFREALQASRDLQEQLDEQRGSALLGTLAGDLGPRLQIRAVPAAPKPAPSQASTAARLLARYRQLVNDYDQAVQHCLQPVDLISGADPDALEQLLRHVGNARQRLFHARAALMQSKVAGELSALFALPAHKPDSRPDLAAALGRMAVGSGARARYTPADVNALLEAALVLTEARATHTTPVIKQLQSLPPLAPAPWLGPTLLQLLQWASTAAGPGGRLIARTMALQQRIEVHVMGHVAAAVGAAGQASVRRATHAPIAELRQQLDRYGASLIEMSGHEHGLGLVLRLPVRVAAAAA